MSKKLTSLADLAKLQFENLAPDPDPIEQEDAPLEKQFLEAHFSNKGRAGKTVTVIKGFEGNDGDLKQLGKTLKKAVGVGGSIKNREIIIQGNYRDQVMKILTDMGHDVKRIGG
jgi:translation initiation factor 1|tara:strand:+ start:1119 stop:1460 length:342 start_codon:yes stop_codon:yes gene_type:complete